MLQILEHIWQMKAPQIVLWGLLLFQRHPHRKGTGGGVLVTVGVWLLSHLGSPTWGSLVLGYLGQLTSP